MADPGPSLRNVLHPRKCRCKLRFARLFLPVATNPLTRRTLLQMLGSTRKGYTPKVSEGGRLADIN